MAKTNPFKSIRLWISLAVAAALFLTFLILLPYGIGYGLSRYLLDNGADQVVIDDVDFNPFTGILAVRGLGAESEGRKKLTLDLMEAEIQWRDLFSRHVHLQQFTISGLEMDIERSSEILLEVGGIRVPVGSSEAGETEKSVWGMVLDNLQIGDSILHYQDEEIKSDLRLTALNLKNLHTRDEKQSLSLLLDATINDAPLVVRLESSPFHSQSWAEGKFQINRLNANRFLPLFQRWLPSLSGHVTVDVGWKVHLDQQGGLQWDTEGTLELAELNLKLEQLGFNGDRLTWKGKNTGRWSQAKGMEMDLMGRFSTQDNQVQLVEPQLVANTRGMQWDGDIKIVQTDQDTDLSVLGALKLQQLHLSGDGKSAHQLAADSIHLNDVNLQLGMNAQQQLEITNQSKLQLMGVNLSLPQAKVGFKNIDWIGDLALIKGGAEQGAAVTLDGRLDLQGLLTETVTEREQQILALNNDQLQWIGRVSTTQDGDETRITAEGECQLHQLTLQDPLSEKAFVKFEQLKLHEVSLAEAGVLGIQTVDLTGLQVVSPKADPAKEATVSDKLSLQGISFSQANGLEIKQVDHTGVKGHIQRNQAGKWQLLELQQLFVKWIAQLNKTQAQEDKVPEMPDGDQEKPLPLRIDRVVWHGDNQIRLVDETVSPPFDITLNIKELEVTGIDSRQPERPTVYHLLAGAGEHTKLNLDGEIGLFQKPLSGQLKGELDAFELPQLTPYSGDTIGYSLDSGKLDANIDVKLNEGKIQAMNKLVIRRLDVSPVNEEKAQAMDQQISMSLGSALGMLEDKHETIDLDLPVTGDLDNPDIDLNDVINTALGKAMKTGAMTYIGATLFPFGTLVALTSMASGAATIQLDPVVFAAAKKEPNKQTSEYLQKVAKLLQERPKIAVKICAFATVADRKAMNQQARERWQQQINALKASVMADKEKGKPLVLPEKPSEVTDEQLLQLAQERAAVVESILVKKYAVDASRTTVCRTKIDPGKDAKPRVDLLL